MFLVRQNMFGEVVLEVEETLEEDSEEGEAIQEVAKSIDLTKITLANLMIKSKGELIGQATECLSLKTMEDCPRWDQGWDHT